MPVMTSEAAGLYPAAFRKFVLRTPTCWLWLGGLVDGYGKFNVREPEHKLKLAHRLSYEATVGEIPSELQLDHLCRVRRCVNPTHLEPVTAKENSHRGLSYRGTQCGRGHAFTEANTRVKSGGGRQCRACWLQSMRDWRSRQRLKVGAP